MRSSHIATGLVAVTAALTASAALRRLADRRLPATAATAAAPHAPVESAPDHGGVVLAFARPVVAPPAPEQPAAPARCGDNGGRTKGGAPCAARATSGGRCHHHPVAA